MEELNVTNHDKKTDLSKVPVEEIQNVYEQFFFLKQYGNWSFIEAYNLPVSLRSWFLKRLQRQFEDEADAREKAMQK